MPKSPPPPKVDVDQQKEDAYVEASIDRQIDMMLANVLHPTATAGVHTVAEAMSLLVAFAHRKGITNDEFMDVLEAAVQGISQIEGIKAEMRILKALNLPLSEGNKDALQTSAELSAKAISAARLRLHEKFLLIRQCKTGATTH